MADSSATNEDTVHPKFNMYKREPSKRVFVNRSLMLDRVKFFGFDMDYTLAMYKSPEYETMGFDHLKNKLVEMGYPEEIKDFEYDHTFPIRGLWFDRKHGTLLKVDSFGNILLCVRGFDFSNKEQIRDMYPTMFAHMEEGRYMIFNTLYELPLIYILACVIDYFINSQGYEQTDSGVQMGDMKMTYESIYNDVETAMGHVHHPEGPLKTDTMKDLDKYVAKDDTLPLILTRMRDNGKKVFLATNSDYCYTNTIMTYMFNTESNTDNRPWTDFFDFIVVDAKKPLFFSQGTVLREVNKVTGQLKLGTFTGKVQPGVVYSGGSSEMFNKMIGNGEDCNVLYAGDHIFGDILKSKKKKGWHTFLLVPEMASELAVWLEKTELFAELSDYNNQIAEIYKNMDSSDTSKPDITEILKGISNVSHKMDQSYGKLGSVFRSGSRQTFFASQVMRYADLYATSITNMLYYPLSYCFRAPHILMAHEVTVEHDSPVTPEQLHNITKHWRSRAEERKPNENKGGRLSRKFSDLPQPHQIVEIADIYDQRTSDATLL